jgi:SAM-dependent methyltransferase
MHENSMRLMSKFVKKYALEKATVVDIGSQDLNGTYRDLFLGNKYIGVDIVEGLNVDMIMGSKEQKALKDIDAVISGQTLEHVADIPALMADIFNMLKSGGLLCIIAPSIGERHDYPIWVGNFSKERMTKIVSDAGFEIIDCTISDITPFKDCCCVAKKPDINAKKRI